MADCSRIFTTSWTSTFSMCVHVCIWGPYVHCSLQSFDDRTEFCQQVPRLEPTPSQPPHQQPSLWLPFPQQLHQPCLFSPAPPLYLALATVPRWSSDSNHQLAALAVRLIGTATNGNPPCSALTVQGRNGESWKERYYGTFSLFVVMCMWFCFLHYRFEMG